MKEVIYLIVSGSKVERMVKNEPSLRNLRNGEIPVKAIVTVDQKAFRMPIIEKEVYVEDWREGIDIADVDFKQTAITPKEAELIRKSRLETMAEIMKQNGYTVTKEETDEHTN